MDELAATTAPARYVEGEPCEVREPQVQSELGRVDDQLEKLGMVVEHLEARLRLVLRDDLTVEAKRIEDIEALVPQAERIRTQRFHIEAVARRLAELLERIEI